jgi:FtsZ-binding cell division protein ZapB
MGITIENDLEKLDNLVQWIKENARISKALSHPAGMSVFRDVVSGKVNALIDRIKSLGRTLLEARPSNSDEIKHQGQMIIEIFTKYDGILMNPQLNVARAFHQSSEELQNLLLKVEEFTRYFPSHLRPSKDSNLSIPEETDFESSADEPSLNNLFSSTSRDSAVSPSQSQYSSQSSPSQTTYGNTRIPLRSQSGSPIRPPPPPQSLPPREYSEVPIIDKVLDLQHEVDLLRQANKYLKDQCNHWQSQVVGGQIPQQEGDNARLRAEISHLQTGVRNLEDERQALLRELQNIRNTLVKVERGDQPPIAPLHDQIRDLIVENHSIRKESTKIAFQRVEHALSSLQSQIDQLINENNDLRSTLPSR